jgi:hypothetical protein
MMVNFHSEDVLYTSTSPLLVIAKGLPKGLSLSKGGHKIVEKVFNCYYFH